MPKYNDFDLKWWKRKQYDNIITDSLWVINEREKSGKHSNFYHWNFIPQIPNQFIQRFTKKGDYVVDFFIWSWTTAIECEKLWRNVIWVDLNKDLIDRLDTLIDWKIDKFFVCGDSTKESTVKTIQDHLKTKKREFVDLVLLHPPYFDIIKFSNKKEDLSNANSINDFLDMFWKVLENCKKLVKNLVFWLFYNSIS